MLTTTVCNWSIIKFVDQNNLTSTQFLWGIIINDETKRFSLNDYVFTTSIKSIDIVNNNLTTRSGNKYSMVGDGFEFYATKEDIELLRTGISPKEIQSIKVSYNDRGIKMISTAHELIEILKTGKLIVLDQLIPEFYIYDYDSHTEQWYPKTTIDVVQTQFENLEKWNELGIISRKRFIGPETSMACSYSSWCFEIDGNQDEVAEASAKRMGL